MLKLPLIRRKSKITAECPALGLSALPTGAFQSSFFELLVVNQILIDQVWFSCCKQNIYGEFTLYDDRSQIIASLRSNFQHFN